MLITTCGHCGARFRVTPQQLNARQGQVRCGRCHGVFSGFESLERHAEDGVVVIAAPAPAPRADPLESLEPLPIEELTGIEPPAAQAAVAPEPKAQPREARRSRGRSEEQTSGLQPPQYLVCRLRLSTESD